MKDLPIRYCPECGHIGEVIPVSGVRDCCPDGDRAQYVPQSVAQYEQIKLRGRVREQATRSHSSMSQDDILLWPDETWCYRYELPEMGFKSDDYETLRVGTKRYDEFQGVPG